MYVYIYGYIPKVYFTAHSFFFFFNHLFIYFWLRWVFVAVRRLLTVVASPAAEPGL